MDVARHQVTCQGNPVDLTSREFDVLKLMMENQQIVLSRDTFLAKVWGYDYVGETNVVDVYIRYLRSKIDDGFNVKLLHTVRGVGYVLREQ
jgi:DNA-binding response OmpR family regulator